MHSNEHDEWCAALAAGDAESVPAELRREMEQCSECAQLLAELREIRGGLTRMGSEEREVLAATRKVPAGAAEQAIERRLRELAPVERPRARRWAWLAAAAVLLVLVGVLALQWSRSNGPTYPQILGHTESFGRMSPSGTTANIERFTWEHALPADGYFTLSWRAADGSGAPHIVDTRLLHPEWTPSPEALAQLPKEFEWSVQVYESRVFRCTSPWVSVSRQP